MLGEFIDLSPKALYVLLAEALEASSQLLDVLGVLPGRHFASKAEVLQQVSDRRILPRLLALILLGSVIVCSGGRLTVELLQLFDNLFGEV